MVQVNPCFLLLTSIVCTYFLEFLHPCSKKAIWWTWWNAESYLPRGTGINSPLLLPFFSLFSGARYYKNSRSASATVDLAFYPGRAATTRML